MSYTTRGGAEIEYPEAYQAAIRNAIYGRASAKRQREWDAAYPHLAAWLSFDGFERAETRDYDGVDQYPEYRTAKHPLGTAPTFALKARGEWGSLSPKATELLQKIFDERTANVAKRAEQRAAEAASAQAWTAGRQVVEGVVVSVKWVEGFARHYGAEPPQVKKVIIKRADGSRVYASAGSGTLSAAEKGDMVRVTLTIEPKAEEPTFAFGSRPAKGEILIEAPRASQEAL